MDNINPSSEVKTKNITLSSVSSWIFGILFAVIGITQLVNHVWAGIFFVIATILLLPPTYSLIKGKLHISLSRGLKIFTIFTLIIVGFGFTLAQMPDTATKQKVVVEKTPVKDAIKVTAAKISADYQNNEVSADLKYKGNIIEVSGIVDSIGKDILNSPYITFQTSDYSVFVTVQCMFSTDDEAELANVTKGQKITLQGEVSGKLMNVIVRDCQIVK